MGFFRDLLLPVIPHHGHVLMGGDLNCVGTDLDVTPNAAGRRRTGYVQGLQLVEDTFGLTDAWREQHPGVRQITHTCAADSSGARLDRWLVSTDILHHVRHTDIMMGLPGDHLGVVITIHSPTGQSRGPAPWSFPMQLLDDPAYVAELTDLVQQILQQHPVCQTYSHGQRWDALKRDIRDHCTEYSRLDRLRQTAETAVLRRRAAELAEPSQRPPQQSHTYPCGSRPTETCSSTSMTGLRLLLSELGSSGKTMESSPLSTSTTWDARGSWQPPSPRSEPPVERHSA